jgi:hypothetical protein
MGITPFVGHYADAICTLQRQMALRMSLTTVRHLSCHVALNYAPDRDIFTQSSRRALSC